MDKKNEVIDTDEQETPFHQLPQEEQQRIVDANQKRVREAPTLHEWDIRVSTAFAWPMILIVVGSMMLFGGAAVWFAGDNDLTFVHMMVGMSIVMTLYLRYLVMADKNYHYRLTTEGLMTTYQDAIPEMAYTIVRWLAWLGVVVCVMAMAVLGPLALVGAGGMAIFAVFCTNFEKKVSVEYTVFNKDKKYVVKVVENRSIIRFDIIPFSWFEFSYLYCNEGELYRILSSLMKELGCDEYREFKSELSLRRAPVGVLDVGTPRRLDEINK
ncbi:hypothetical protein SJR90_03175 [Aeromonas caviae]|uniref:hypothetical protein n=1 Tax=Aeromonas caviae TaxID=648 RepID=UPI0029D931D0|nr:hypothetical protein [Aeromonas caviae]MDX7781363.1 hypothetical protein [Aeromonas caviae]MDX7891025.1 hypothetical protein [Aeromonas caviae]MDY7763041.1 hypothetical protein [Aeromonas caviae]